jgi:hypothetical protein
VIVPFERDEASAANARGEGAAFLERLHRVAAAMQHQGRNGDAGEEVGHVDLVHRAPDARGILGRGGFFLQLVEPVPQLRRRAGHEHRGEYLAKRRILLAPALAHESEQRVSLFDLLG